MNTPANSSSVPPDSLDSAATSSSSYYRAILYQLPQAFCVGEVLFDEQGTAVDYRLMEVNAAFEQQTTWPNPVGHTLRALAPELEAVWYEQLEQVIRTGQVANFEQQAPCGGNHRYEVQALPIGPPGSSQVALLMTDVTARRQTETALRSSQDRQMFLVRLGDELRPLTDATQVQAVAARLLGQHLRANQVHYGETQGDDVVIAQGYGDGLPAMTGRFRSVDFGEKLTATHRAGIVQVISDIETDSANNEAERQVLRQARIGAYITVPLLKEGQWVATLAVHSLTPRSWTVDEVRLVEDVAERTWAAVERARAEAAQRELEQRFRLMADAVPQIVWLTDADGRVEFFNKQWSDYTGAPYEPTTAAEVSATFVHPDDGAATMAAFAEARATGTTFLVEHRIRSRAGEYRWFLVRAEPHREASTGEIVRWYGASVDIHHRKQAEVALAKAHERLQLAMNTGRIFSFEMHPETRALELSDNVDVVMGFPLPDHIDSTFELIHPDDLQPTVALINGAIDSRGSYASEYRLVNPANGEVVWFHSQAAFTRTNDSGEWRFVGIAQNITESKRAQEALRESEEKYRSLFETMDQGFAVCELLRDETGQATDFRYLELNPALEQQTGLSRDLALRSTVKELVPGLEDSLVQSFARMVETGESMRFDYYVEPMKRWYHFLAFPQGGQRFAVLYDDITARKEAEEVLRQNEARQSYLLSLSDALGSVADAGEMQDNVVQTAMDYFQADRCYYGEIDGDTVLIRRDAARPGLSSVAASYALDTMPVFRALLQTQQPVVVADVSASPHMDDNLKALCQGFGIGAYIIVPVVKDGVQVGLLNLTQAAPREWTALEVSLMQETAERTWAAVERANAEEALRESEALLQKAFSIATVGQLYFTLDGGMTAANAAFARMTGYREEELLTLDWSVLTPPEFADVTARAVGELAERGETAPYEKQFVRPDGARWWALCSPTRLKGEGFTAACMEFVIDINERKQAEEQLRTLAASLEEQVAERTQALQASHHQLNTIFEAVPLQLGYYEAVRDASGQIVDLRAVAVNQSSSERMNLPDDAPGRLMSNQLPGLRELPVWQTMTQVIETGQPQRLELHHQFGNGEGVWFDVLYTRLDDGIINASLDITARKHMEQELRNNQELLQLVFDSSPMALSVQQAVRNDNGEIKDFRVLMLNQELERELGRTDMVGKHYVQEYPGMKASGLFDLMRKTVETGEPQQMEYYYPYEGFNRWFSCMFVKLNDGVVATNLDITPRKRAEEERFRNFALLQQSEEVAGIGSWDYHVDTGAFLWSDGMYRLFDLPLGTPVTPDFYLDVAVAEDYPIAERLVHKLTQQPSSFEKQLRVRVAGEVKTLRLKAEVIRDATGQPERVLGVDLDISEVQRLEADNLHIRLTQQQALFEAVQQAQETERKRIAEGLHNGIGQLLFATKLRLDQLQSPVLAAEPPLAAARQEADRLLAEAIRQTRVLSHELVPRVLEDFGLENALQGVCSQLSTSHLRLRCHVALDQDVPPLPPLLQLALYRMAQELGLNIVKHAYGATEASLELETMPGFVLLRAQDNGAGFATDPTTSPGQGLRTIRDRVALLNGTLDIGHHAEFGTYVRLRLPLPAEPSA